MHFPALLVVAAATALASAQPEDGVVSKFDKFAFKCHRSDSGVDGCLKKQLIESIRIIKNDGLPNHQSVEPYFVDEIGTDLKAGPAEFKIFFRNMTVRHMTDVVINDIRTDLRSDSMRMDIDLTFPKMTFQGIFKMGGRFGTTAFKGHGPLDVSFSNIVATWSFFGEKEPGSEFMTVKSVTPSYTIGGMHAYGKGYIDDSPLMDDLINSLINRLWPDVYALGKPYAQKPMAFHLQRMSNWFFQAVPYDTIFPA